MKRILIAFWFFIISLSACAAPISPPVMQDTGISGTVIDEENDPLAGVVVRIKATKLETVGDDRGVFSLTGLHSEDPVFVTAWAPGYYINGVDDVLPGTTDLEIVLKKHTDRDNPGYEFLSAFSSAGMDGNCQNCHADEVGSSLPFSEWQQDAHALSAQNPRFISMYLGQDLDGKQSPPRRFDYNRDYGRVPLPPDLTQPYFGPGYKLDFPGAAGNCAACHAPVTAIDAAYAVDPTRVTDVGTEGVTCDFCHKVWGVLLDPAGNLPGLNMPGVLSFEFRRPEKGHQFFAGPLDDVAPGEDTYSPVQRQSQFCAPCHFGMFWDTPIYNSFGEWLGSSYSDTGTGKTCQDCHMPAGKNDHFARLDKGGVVRDPSTIFSHLMPGASDVALLRNAVSMTVDAEIKDNQLIVEVKIVNDQTGHHVPTDSPLRQMILLVSAADRQGQTLSLQNGPTVPDYGGLGDPARGYYAGLPGKIFAKILIELWTEVILTGAYWNPTRIVSDNRLPAFGSDTSVYSFALPANESAEVQITLLFRRAFKELMDQKGWDVPDIVMDQQTLQVGR